MNKFVVRIIHYFANLIARRSEKSDSLFTWQNVCCNLSWTAVFVFHAGFLGWVNNLGNWEMYAGYLVTKAASILLSAENGASRVVFSLSLANMTILCSFPMHKLFKRGYPMNVRVEF
jgi:hypothetical protein